MYSCLQNLMEFDEIISKTVDKLNGCGTAVQCYIGRVLQKLQKTLIS